MGIVAEQLLQTIVASAVTHATNGFTYDVLTLHLKTILHYLVVLKTGIARTALVIVTEDKDNYQYEERDTMNKQMKNGNSSLLHKDKDTKNKQMKRDSSSLEPEDSATVGKQMKRDSSSLEPASPPNTLKLNLLVVVSAFEW